MMMDGGEVGQFEACKEGDGARHGQRCVSVLMFIEDDHG